MCPCGRDSFDEAGVWVVGLSLGCGKKPLGQRIDSINAYLPPKSN
jgi:hypothetical protein